MRSLSNNTKGHLGKFVKLHKYSSKKKVASLASYALVLEMRRARDKGLPVVAFDLAGAEQGYPAVDHKDAYRLAHKMFFKKTVHAGEAYGAESIFQALTDLHADRIGHGYYLFAENMIEREIIQDKQRYINKIVQYIADRRITIEVCLTSNIQTNPKLKDLHDHSFKKMLANNLSTTICTDNRTVSKTTVSKELELATNTFNLSSQQLKNNMIYGFKRSFFPGTYIEKREYVSRVIDKYEEIEKKFSI